MAETIEQLKALSGPILTKYQIKKSAVFGSFARSEHDKKSDIDILIEFKPGAGGLLQMVRLKRDLEKATRRSIDLGTFRSVNKLIKAEVQRDLIKIYG